MAHIFFDKLLHDGCHGATALVQLSSVLLDINDCLSDFVHLVSQRGTFFLGNASQYFDFLSFLQGFFCLGETDGELVLVLDVRGQICIVGQAQVEEGFRLRCRLFAFRICPHCTIIKSEVVLVKLDLRCFDCSECVRYVSIGECEHGEDSAGEIGTVEALNLVVDKFLGCPKTSVRSFDNDHDVVQRI